MSDIKFCVTAFVDLLGFESHLEIGADLRTRIGQQAIERLDNLKQIMIYFQTEKSKYPDHYPHEIDIKRINDALIITMDLPDVLKPEVGEQQRKAISEKHFEEVIKEMNNQNPDEEEANDVLMKTYIENLKTNTRELMLFVGIVGRIFTYLKKKEAESTFPGPKAVVCTGYRKSYKTLDNQEDYLSANFAFSNSYIAEKELKGSSLYFDSHILQLISITHASKNIAAYSLLIPTDTDFDPTKEYEDPLHIPSSSELKKKTEIYLFRKKYVFREVNARVISHFQLLEFLLPFLTGSDQINTYKVFEEDLKFINSRKSFEELQSRQFSIFNLINMDISEDLRTVKDFLTNKDSEFLRTSNKGKMLFHMIFGQ